MKAGGVPKVASNLHLANPPGLISFLQEVIDREGRVYRELRDADVVDVSGHLFYRLFDEATLGGPFETLAQLIRGAGLRRRQMEGPGHEVWEWRGSWFRVEADAVQEIEAPLADGVPLDSP